jgi:hypothetical protein
MINKNNMGEGNNEGGIIDALLGTVANFLNTIIHEKTHRYQHLAGDKRSIEELELDAIKAQKAHSTWGSTTKDYQESNQRYEAKQYSDIIKNRNNSGNREERSARKVQECFNYWLNK